jgi:hypothetical protein
MRQIFVENKRQTVGAKNSSKNIAQIRTLR